MHAYRSWIVAGLILTLGLRLQGMANASSALGSDFQEDVNVNFVASLGGEVGAMRQSGKLVYLGQGNRLRVIDVSTNPPRETGTLYLDHVISSIAQYRSYLYIFAHRYWNGYGVLKIIDISDPTHPREKCSLEPAPWDGRAYVNPEIYGSFLVGYGRVFDLAPDPLDPESNELDARQRAIIFNSYPGSVSPKQDIDTPPVIPNYLQPMIQLAEPQDLQVMGNYAYVIDEGMLKTVEIAQPEKARVINALKLPCQLAKVSIKETGTYAVDTSSTIYRLNMANPAAPSVLGSIRLTAAINDLDSTGSFVYLATKSGVQVIDFTQSAQPRRTSELNTEHSPQSIRISGGRAWFSDGVIHSLDLRNPSAPVLTPIQISVPAKPVNSDLDDDPDRMHDSRFTSVQVRQDHVYALEHGAGGDDYTIDVYDTHKPASEALVNRLSKGDYFHRFDEHLVSGNDLIIRWHGHNSQMSYDGLSIFDITDPSKKHEIAQYTKLREVHRVVARGDMIYVADGKCGLVFLKLKRPGNARK